MSAGRTSQVPTAAMAPLAPLPPLALYGWMVQLAGRSALHRSWDVARLERLFVPPVSLGQVFAGLQPAWFATWARLSEDAEARWRAGGRLMPADWQSGERVWIVDAICPAGGTLAMARTVRRHLSALADAQGWRATEARWLRRDGAAVRKLSWAGRTSPSIRGECDGRSASPPRGSCRP